MMMVDGKKIRRLYVATTKDKYELPEIVADSTLELSQFMGVRKNSVDSAISKQKHGVRRKSMYVVVEIEDDEDET